MVLTRATAMELSVKKIKRRLVVLLELRWKIDELMRLMSEKSLDHLRGRPQ